MKIYTGYGDEGYTQLIGGKRAKKCCPRVQTYGAIDTLNSQIGVVAAFSEGRDQLKAELIKIQHWVFDCSSDFSTSDQVLPYKVTGEMVSWLEAKIDSYCAETPELKSFILPGGGILTANLHVCRCLTREVERKAVELMEAPQEQVNLIALQFLNRLSDYFFALARWVSHQEGQSETLYVVDQRRE